MRRVSPQRVILESSDEGEGEETGRYPLYFPTGSPAGFPIESPMDSQASSPETSPESSPAGSRATSPTKCLPTTSATSLKRTYDNLENGRVPKFF